MTIQTDPLGTLDVVATNDHFCDPAIDLVDPNPPEEVEFDGSEDTADQPVVLPYAQRVIVHYRKTREVKDLPVKTGLKLTLFRIRQLKTKFTPAVDGMSFEAQLLYAFCAACFEVKLPDGTSLKPRRAKEVIVIGGHTMPDEEHWVELVRKRFGIATILEVGSVAFQKARLPEDAKGAFLCAVGLPPEVLKKH